MLLEILTFLTEVAVVLVGGACLVRVAMRWRRMSLANPVGQFVQAVSDWLVLPLARVLPAAGRIDAAGLLAAWLLKLLQYTLLMSVLGSPRWGVLPVLAVLGVVKLAVSVATAIVIIAAVMSWMQNRTRLADVLQRLSEPLLAPLRRWLPLVGGIDLSPLAAIVALQVLGIVIGSLQASLLGSTVVLGGG